METDDYLLDDLQRSQLNATRRRRWNRSRRQYRFLLLSIGFLAPLVLAAPSLISHSGIARSMLASRALAYGWTASADSLDVGWITPLSIKGLKLVGQSGETTIDIERADTALTVTDLLRFDPASVGEVSLRGVNLACTVIDRVGSGDPVGAERRSAASRSGDDSDPGCRCDADGDNERCDLGTQPIQRQRFGRWWTCQR